MPMLFYLITSICFAILLKRFSIAIDISSYYPLIYFELHDSIYLTVRLIYLFATFLPYFPVLVFTYFLKFALFYIMYFFAFFIFTNYELVAYFASIINGLLQLPLFDKNIITYTSLIFIATTLLNFIYSIQLTSVILYCAFHFLLIYFRILVFQITIHFFLIIIFIFHSLIISSSIFVYLLPPDITKFRFCTVFHNFIMLYRLSQNNILSFLPFILPFLLSYFLSSQLFGANDYHQYLK